ncbi:MAG TPA: type VI secretion system baseplate subunit TssF [Gammaproteobacteria bacterium]|nr:type VI secretion system baseplate subunit TssF [Gammaproteobacteria bacterium]
MNFQSYFDAEMRALQHIHDENAEPDPSVDRILEGVAYLTAQIHQRLDADFPEIPAQLLHQHWPYMLQPYASRIIVEFSSNTQTIIPKSTVISSQPVGEEKTSCKFATLDDLIIYPIILLKIELSHTALKFYFESKQANLKLDKLKLYLNTDINTALELYYALGQGAEIKSPTNLWLDYFGFREQFLFLEINNIHIDSHNKFFEATLPFKHSLSPGIEIKKECFKLNCVAAINEYHTQSEPIVYKSSQYDYEIIPDRNHRESILLQSIQEISALDHKKINYQWEFLRKKLRVHDKALENNTPLSCDVVVTNGHYPNQYIRENSMNNIVRPSPYLLPPMHKDYLWQLISVLNLNIHKLDLKKTLNLFNWSDKKAYLKQIDSIVSLENKPINKIIKGIFYQGSEFILSIKEEGFRNVSEIYLFGCVLHNYLKLISSVNTLIKTRILLFPSSRILVWD